MDVIQSVNFEILQFKNFKKSGAILMEVTVLQSLKKTLKFALLEEIIRIKGIYKKVSLKLFAIIKT